MKLERKPWLSPPTKKRSSSSHLYNLGVIGESPSMHEVYQLIYEAILSPAHVLITGEIGTGKDLIAKTIHCGSPRRHDNFIVLNCASTPTELLEPRLFGYQQGAHRNANPNQPGLIHAADEGTLLLNNIGEMHLSVQAKLSQLLKTGEIQPPGASQSHKVDVRVIATTRSDLRARVECGLFRKDLFYRISTVAIAVPPLRDRREDIQYLARHFVSSACAFLDRPPCRLSDAAVKKLVSYDYPDNVRELHKLVKRAVLSCEDDDLLADDFDFEHSLSTSATLSLAERMERLERNLLIDRLRSNDGNQSSTARELAVPRRTLLYRMKKLGINSGDIEKN